MEIKKKVKKQLVAAGALFMAILVCMSMFIMNARADYDTWNSLVYLDMTKDTGEGQHSLKDVTSYSGNYTNDVGKIYADVSHYFDDIRLDADSRLTYGRKIRVDAGQQLNIVAAKEDTADAGGESSNAGLRFYWSMCEYDENGNIVFDGGWRSSGDIWTVGFTENSDTGYGKDGYPNGENAAGRQSKVRYVVPIFRWNNGDQSIGSGNQPIYANAITRQFPIFYLITEPFTYTFDLNGGNINGSTDKYTMQRLGTGTVSVSPTPQRDGYVFTGWKITSQSGKQTGRVYDAGKLAEMFSDSKYYSSLFEDAVFEAQWAAVDQFVTYIGNGADNMADYYQSYAAANENKYNKIGFSKTGYTAERTWEAKDKFGNYWYSPKGDGTETMPQLSGGTTIRTKVDLNYAVDLTSGSPANGTNIEIWNCFGNTAQTFYFQYIKTENGIPYWIIRNGNGKALDVDTGSAPNGTSGNYDGANVQQWECHGGDNQLWTLRPAGDGYFYICSKLDNNLVLDLWGGGSGVSAGQRIAISGFHGGDNQKWCLWDSSINLYANWTNNGYRVQYDADGGTLYDTAGNETEDNTQDCAYDTTYTFYTADRAYTVSYEPNGGTVSLADTNTSAYAVFNGWNERLDAGTDHGILNGWDGWCLGEWNWAAYYNANPDLLNVTGNVYDTMAAIYHYRTYGISQNRQFNGNSCWNPKLSFQNFTANGGTVYAKADYTNGSVTLPEAQKKTEEQNGIQTAYIFEGWYTDAALTKRAGGAGEKYKPDTDMTLYAKYINDSQRIIYNQKICVRYENADGTWGAYEDWLDSDFKAGDTVQENWAKLDVSKWVKPDMICYQVGGSYAVDGYETKVDIRRRMYAVSIKYDNNDAFTDKHGEGSYRWGETVTAGVILAEGTQQYIYQWNGFGISEGISLTEESTKMSNPITFIMPEKDTELLAYSSNAVNLYVVTVEHYYMDIQGRYPDTATKVQDIGSLEYGTELYFANLQQERTGFTYNEEKTSGENGTQAVITVTADSIIRLYYDRNRYTVVYQGNKGEAVQDIPVALSVYYDEEFTISLRIPTRTGFTFINWNTKAEGTGVVCESGQTAKNLTAENNGTVILYAQWEQKKFQIVSSASNRGSSRKFIKRTSHDERWYETSGGLSAEELLTVLDEECLAVMHIDQSGAITQLQ